MSILGVVAIVQKDEQCFSVSYHGNRMYHLEQGSSYFSALFSGIFSNAAFRSDETHACVHRVAVKRRTALFQGFMQQTADLKKGSLEGSQAHGYLWISTKKHPPHPNATGDITFCQTGHAIYKYSVH